jgi:hypothetical protein
MGLSSVRRKVDIIDMLNGGEKSEKLNSYMNVTFITLVPWGRREEIGSYGGCNDARPSRVHVPHSNPVDGRLLYDLQPGKTLTSNLTCILPSYLDILMNNSCYDI